MKGASTSKFCLNVQWVIVKRLVKSILVGICLCCLRNHVNTIPPLKTNVIFSTARLSSLGHDYCLAATAHWGHQTWYELLRNGSSLLLQHLAQFLVFRVCISSFPGVSFSVNSEGEKLGKQRAEVKPRYCSWCKWSTMIRVAQHFSIDGRATLHVFWCKSVNDIFCGGVSKMALRQVCNAWKQSLATRQMCLNRHKNSA